MYEPRRGRHLKGQSARAVNKEYLIGERRRKSDIDNIGVCVSDI